MVAYFVCWRWRPIRWRNKEIPLERWGWQGSGCQEQNGRRLWIHAENGNRILLFPWCGLVWGSRYNRGIWSESERDSCLCQTETGWHRNQIVMGCCYKPRIWCGCTRCWPDKERYWRYHRTGWLQLRVLGWTWRVYVFIEYRSEAWERTSGSDVDHRSRLCPEQRIYRYFPDWAQTDGAD